MQKKIPIKNILISFVLILQILNVNASIIKRRGRQSVSIYERLVGEDVELECSLSKIYGNEVDWRRPDEKNMRDNEKIDGRIKLKNLEEDDSGEYECTYGDQYADDLQSDRVELRVRVSNQNQAQVDSTTTQVPSVEETQPSVEEETQPADEETTQEVFFSETTQAVFLPETTQIVEKEPDSFDPPTVPQTTESIYQTEPDTTTSYTNWDDEEGFHIKTQVQKKAYIIKNGQDIVIVCNSQTNAFSIKFFWLNQKRENIEPNDKYQISTSTIKSKPLTKQSTLTIKNANADDVGKYVCSATTGLADDEASITITIEQITVETNVITGKELEIEVDGSDEVTCRSTTNGHSLEILWINPNKIQIVPDNFYDIKTKILTQNPLTVEATLKFLRVRTVDHGNYECRAIAKSIDTYNDVTTESSGIFFIKIKEKIVVEDDCPCNNHSDCTCSGFCLECKHNTYGDHCQYCLPGYQGDATRGSPYDCQPVEKKLPTTTSSTTTRTLPPTTTLYIQPEPDDDCFCNGHSFECTCSGICIRCAHNTKGDKCQYCADDYEGDATGGTPFDCARKISHYSLRNRMRSKTCNEHGTLKRLGNTCLCKSGVTGQYCDECKPRYFSFINENSNYKKGCLSCFCNGLSVECKSSDSYYRKKISYFENEDWYISNKYTQLKENVQFIQNGILFDKIKSFNSDDLYFIVSSQFKGNHLVSYNGELSFKFKYELLNYKNNNNNQKLEIRISGNNINLIHVFDQELVPNVENQISVKLNENSFKRYGDNGSVEREFFLMALADIELIMIKAKLSNDQTTASLSDFSIEYADSKDSSLRQATSVEICNCPVEYTGTSCESCASGYKRSSTGFYWGVCESD